MATVKELHYSEMDKVTGWLVYILMCVSMCHSFFGKKVCVSFVKGTIAFY